MTYKTFTQTPHPTACTTTPTTTNASKSTSADQKLSKKLPTATIKNSNTPANTTTSVARPSASITFAINPLFIPSMTERPSNNSLLPPSIRKYLEESEEQIQAIKTVNDIKEVVGADAALLLVGERIPAICRLYATLVQEHERIIKEKFHLIGHYQALDASVTKFFEATQKVLDGLNAQDQILEQSRQRVEAELLRDLDELKNAIGQAQLISAFDRRRVHLASPYLLPLAITDQFPPWLPDRSPEATFLLSPTAWFDLCRRKNYARGMVIVQRMWRNRTLAMRPLLLQMHPMRQERSRTQLWFPVVSRLPTNAPQHFTRSV
ncbi:hypothetical protein CC2G_012512 [Coprinopsis cinerea AmutBmut pab1-1]|nr:hypothetical protein CC2G_012512 [Coprinopsis cinerea AmutBmut pab1-1]